MHAFQAKGRPITNEEVSFMTIDIRNAAQILT